MKSLYLILDLGSLIVPLIFSFHPSIKFYKEWKTTIPALFISAILFVLWDIKFTEIGVWGFNADYLIGIDFYNLPLEELLFFICIPYACLFTHFCFKKFLFKQDVSKQKTQIITVVFFILLFSCSIIFIEQNYTFFNFVIGSILLIISFFANPKELGRFYLSFLFILIPFFIVNGILTGSLLTEPVVWYNNNEIIGLRLGTIPAEDIVYAFNMLIFPLLINSGLKKLISLPEMTSKNH